MSYRGQGPLPHGLIAMRSRMIAFCLGIALVSRFPRLPADCPDRSQVFSQRRIMLNFYGAERMEPGQRWMLRVRLNKLHGFANPGGFDYEGWLFQQGFAAKGYIRDNPFNVRLEDGPPTLSRLP